MKIRTLELTASWMVQSATQITGFDILIRHGFFNKQFFLLLWFRLNFNDRYSFYSTGATCYQLYDVMDGTFQTLMAEGRPSTPREKVADDLFAALSDVVTGLNELHKHGIMHGDVKPDNILVSRDPTGAIYSCLSDFGFVKFLHPNIQYRNTKQKGNYFICYARDKFESLKIDIFSIGLVIFSMLVYLKTNSGIIFDKLRDLRKKILSNKGSAMIRQHLRLVLPDQDLDLIELIVQCVHIDPYSRPQCGVIISFLRKDQVFTQAKANLNHLLGSHEFIDGFAANQLLFPEYLKRAFKANLDGNGKELPWVSDLEKREITQQTSCVITEYINAENMDGFVESVNNFAQNN